MGNGESSYRRFLEGDETAFEEIINEYRLGLEFFINSFVGNLSVSEDIAVDVFVYVLNHKNKYNFSVSLKTYLYTIGRSRAIDYLRKNKRIVSLNEAELENRLSDEAELENEVIKSEEYKALYKALDALNKEAKNVIHLQYFEELSYREIAKILKISEKKVENISYRSKKKLKENLLKEGEWL